MNVQTTLYSLRSLVSLPLTDGGEGAEEGRGRGEEERGVGVEGAALRAERGGLTVEPWTSVLASTVAYPAHRSFLRLVLPETLSVGADLVCRHPMTAQDARTEVDED